MEERGNAGSERWDLAVVVHVQLHEQLRRCKGPSAMASGPAGAVRPICAANSELLLVPAGQQSVARRLQPQKPKTRHGGFWIEHSL
jgi:hypothetical protein